MNSPTDNQLITIRWGTGTVTVPQGGNQASQVGSDRLFVLGSRAMQDTSPAAERRYFELLKAQTPLQRLNTAVRLSEAVRVLARAGILQTYPDATPDEVNARLAERLYGRAVAERLFPDVAIHMK